MKLFVRVATDYRIVSPHTTIADLRICRYTLPMPVATRNCEETIRSARFHAVPRPATGKTFIARVRVAKDKWDEFGAAADQYGIDRSKLVNEWIDWFLRRPGTRAPRRPDAAQD